LHFLPVHLFRRSQTEQLVTISQDDLYGSRATLRRRAQARVCSL
jgi:hypothetical protein